MWVKPKSRTFVVFRRWAELCVAVAGLLAALALFAQEGAKPDSSKRPTPTNHWAFQPVKRPAIPQIPKADQRFVFTPADNFVLAELKKRKIDPAPEADRTALVRRVYFDLIGLPPSREQITQFLNDKRPDAYEQLVETLLSSPQYGERWGRHWLDAAGYADSNGYFDADSDRPLAWKYRDYVIRSVNDDKPFDQFVREQVAGDELTGYSPNGDITPDMEERLIATHFLRNAPDGTGESDGNAAELRVDRYSVIEGTVQLIGSVFMGLTVQCARCHDHKFEPLAQDEYYQLQAILRPAYDPDHWLKPRDRLLTTGTRSEREKTQAAIDRADREIKATKESIDGLTKPFRNLLVQENLQTLPGADRAKIQKALDAKEKDRNKEMKDLLKKHEALVDIKEEVLLKRFPELAGGLGNLQQSLKAREQQRPAALPQISPLVEPAATPPAHFILVRGNYAKPGREVQPGVPAILCRTENRFEIAPRPAGSSGRRLAFARWLTSTNNPVMARLMVNRIWQHHFGVGLVATADNFGVTGAKPSHPELLDFLTSEFVRNGWKLKPLHRLIVNSATYRQSSAYREVAQRVDPDNKWLSRFPTQRLDSESIRDSMLATTGELDLRMGGPFVEKDKTEEGQYVIVETKPGAHRRSLYLQQRRTTPVTFLDVFDGARMNPNCVQRTTSTVALQSLALLNSDFVRTRSKALATRIMRDAETRSERIVHAFRLALGRQPTSAERQAAEEFFVAQLSASASDSRSLSPGERAGVKRNNASEVVTSSPSESANRNPQSAIDNPATWADFCQTLFASNGFLFIE